MSFAKAGTMPMIKRSMAMMVPLPLSKMLWTSLIGAIQPSTVKTLQLTSTRLDSLNSSANPECVHCLLI